jgi:glucosamine--fructose-6-phosphate aminotransferase (isomerizing)
MTSVAPTRMFVEAAQAPALARIQLGTNGPLIRELAKRLRARPPRAVTTLGRGSSDNAATFARYLIETRLGVMTASTPPSVSSIYESAQDLADTLCLVVSQSGKSPDLLAAAHAAVTAGALVVAMVNAEDSPLARIANVTIPLGAGPELSVAATKSFIAALVTIVQLVAAWSEERQLLNAVDGLPEMLGQAWALDWGAGLAPLTDAQHLYVVGRGVGFGIAQEAALKFKETCGLHAEAFSTAEVRHGPAALVGPSFPVLAFLQDDETAAGVEAAVAAFARQGAPVIVAGRSDARGIVRLPSVRGHPALEPIAQAQSFYRMVNDLALLRGRDPDRPPHLAKITETT